MLHSATPCRGVRFLSFALLLRFLVTWHTGRLQVVSAPVKLFEDKALGLRPSLFTSLQALELRHEYHPSTVDVSEFVLAARSNLRELVVPTLSDYDVRALQRVAPNLTSLGCLLSTPMVLAFSRFLLCLTAVIFVVEERR